METIPVPPNGANSFPQKNLSLIQRQDLHHLAKCMSTEQMERGRVLGTLRSIHQRLWRKIQKDLARLNGYASKLGLPAHQLSSSTGNQLEASTGPAQPVEQVGSQPRESMGIGISSSSGEEKTRTRPSPSGGSLRGRTRAKPPVPEPDMAPGFLRFWSCYGRRCAKQEAYRAWMDLRPNAELEDQICEAATRQFETNFKDTDISKIPHPASWLRAARWEDEIFDQEARAHANWERIVREKDEAVNESKRQKSAAMGRKEVSGEQDHR